MDSESYMGLYKVMDGAKKDAKYISTSISTIRRDWRNLKSPETMRENKAILFSQQSMDKIIKQFKDKQFKKETDFIPLGIWNRIVNTIVEEITKNPPKIELRANDATALSDKKEDITRLRLKAMHEDNINAVNKKVGLQPYAVGYDKFKSNVDEFVRLNLNPSDPEDVEFFERSGYQRLKSEIAGQKLINAIFKINKFDEEIIRDFVLDILSALAVCAQVYVDQITGEIKINRIYPEEAYGIWGDKRDGSDDIAKGYVTNLTLREWLGRVGNEFKMDRDWVQLLWALNYANSQKYTGFQIGNMRYSIYDTQWGVSADEIRNNGITDRSGGLLNWNTAWTYKIYSGYVEWSSPEVTGKYLEQLRTGEIVATDFNYEGFLKDSKENKEYQTVSYYQEQMYKSYFIATSSTSQWEYNWGKVHYSQLYGANDEYAKGTLWYYRMEGTPAAEISKFYVELANLTAYRMKWVVYHSKPKKEQYVIEELIKVAKNMQRMYPQGTSQSVPTVDNILTDLIKWKRENFIDLRSFPEIEGKTYPMLTPQEGSREGLDPLAIALQSVEEWAERQIAEKIGLNDIRLGEQQNKRAGLGQNQMETQSSYNSTGYIYRMIQFPKESIATIILNYAQDIIKFEDTLPYKYLLKMLGDGEFHNIAKLEDFAAHRYGIFVDNFTSKIEKQALMGAAQQAVEKGQISFTEYGILLREEDVMKALQLLDLYKYKADKKARAQKLEEIKMSQQHEKEMAQMEQQSKQQEQQSVLAGKKIDADATKYNADKMYQKTLDSVNVRESKAPEKTEAKVEGQKSLATHKKDLEEQESY